MDEGIYTLIGTLLGSLIVVVSNWMQGLNIRKQKETKEIAEKSANELIAFYALQDLYLNEIADLRTVRGDKTFNTPDGIKRQFRERLRNDLDLTFTLSKSINRRNKEKL